MLRITNTINKSGAIYNNYVKRLLTMKSNNTNNIGTFTKIINSPEIRKRCITVSAFTNFGVFYIKCNNVTENSINDCSDCTEKNRCSRKRHQDITLNAFIGGFTGAFTTAIFMPMAGAYIVPCGIINSFGGLSWIYWNY
jgi:hypothetical protein